MNVGATANASLSLASDGAINTHNTITFGKQPSGSYAPAYVGYITTDATGNSKGDIIFGARSVTTDSVPTERVRIDSSGNVGIGETIPLAKTHIKSGNSGHTWTSLSSSYDDLAIEGSGNTGITIFTPNNNNAGIAFADEDSNFQGAIIYIHNDDAMAFRTDATERMRIDSSGRVGIKGTPSSWDAAFDVLQIGGITSLYTESSLASKLSNNIYYSSGNKYYANGEASSYIQQFGTHIWATASSGTANTTATLTERMRIDSSGHLTIGKSSYDPRLYMTSTGGNGVNERFYIDGFADGGGAGYGGGFRIYTRDTVNVFHDRMIIDSSGRVAIATSPSTSYASTLRIATQAGSNILELNQDGTGTYLAIFTHGSTVVGSITESGTTTSYNTTSDYRLKENVVPMEGALDRVDALKPSRFNFIADADKTVDGFLAHEVAEVVPEAISGEKDAMETQEYEVSPAVYEDVVHPAVEEVLDDDGNVVTPAQEEYTERVLVSEAVMGTREVPVYQGIDQSKLVPLLTAALQEAHTLIKELTARVEALESN